MKSLKIIVSLDSKTAIRLGQAQAGEAAYPLAGVLPLLTVEQREWFATRMRANHQHNDEGLRLLTSGSYPYALDLPAAPTDEVVAAAIVREIGAAQERDREALAASEAKILEALAAPDADWLTENRDGCYYTAGDGVSSDSTGTPHGRPRVDTSPRGIYLDDAQKTDPRIATRRAEVEANTLPGAIAEWEAKHAEWQTSVAARKAREAEAQAAKQAAREAMRMWAESCEQLPTRIRRAAADGLDVYPALKRHLGDAVREVISRIASKAVGHCTNTLGGEVVDTYDSETSTRVPSDEAYAIFDVLTAAKDEIAVAAIVPGVEVTVGPFLRVNVAYSGKIWRSAVDVAVSHPWFGDLGDHVLTEPANLPDEANDEANDE